MSEAAPAKSDILQTLDQILASPLFVQAHRQRRLLRYIVEQSLGADAGRLSQFSIGIDVFERDAEFDPAIDSVVRVEVARLRSRLREYYEAAPQAAIVIRIPKGRYIAVFEGTGESVSAQTDQSKPKQRSSRPVLAVLPFTSRSAEDDDAYFATGIAEDLITDLSKVTGLTVIARNSSFAYRDEHVNLALMSNELGATHVLQGSVRRAGERLRINAQLSYCETGEQLWAERYDRQIADIFDVQDEVGQRIIEALSVALTAVDRYRLSGAGTQNLEAYDLYLRAATLSWKRSDVEEAVRLYEAAAALDPEFAQAHARRATLLCYQWQVGWEGKERLHAALAAASKAIEIDSQLGDGHAMAAFVYFWLHEHEASEAAFKRVEELEPDNVLNMERRAICLSMLGRAAEAAQCVDKVRRVNPHEPYFFPRAAIAFVQGQLDEALALLQSSAERFPTFVPTRIYLAAALALTEQTDTAAEHIAYLRREAPGVTPDRLLDQFPMADQGERSVRNGFRMAWEACAD